VLSKTHTTRLYLGRAHRSVALNSGKSAFRKFNSNCPTLISFRILSSLLHIAITLQSSLTSFNSVSQINLACLLKLGFYRSTSSKLNHLHKLLLQNPQYQFNSPQKFR
jgi:hypothetical protein